MERLVSLHRFHRDFGYFCMCLCCFFFHIQQHLCILQFLFFFPFATQFVLFCRSLTSCSYLDSCPSGVFRKKLIWAIGIITWQQSSRLIFSIKLCYRSVHFTQSLIKLKDSGSKELIRWNVDFSICELRFSAMKKSNEEWVGKGKEGTLHEWEGKYLY